MVDGLQLDGSHQVKIWDLNGNGTYVSTSIASTSTDGYPTAMHDDTDTNYDLSSVFLPETTNSTESNGTFSDYCYSSDAGEDNVCYSGGYWGGGAGAGLFNLDLHHVSSNAPSGIGSRLAKV